MTNEATRTSLPSRTLIVLIVGCAMAFLSSAVAYGGV
jgi:hypothetical protein